MGRQQPDDDEDRSGCLHWLLMKVGASVFVMGVLCFGGVQLHWNRITSMRRRDAPSLLEQMPWVIGIMIVGGLLTFLLYNPGDASSDS